MSDPLFESQRVAVACKNCRERKIKQQPCMRCEANGLVCEYVSPDKQKARGSKTRGHDNTGYSPNKPPSTKQKNPNLGGDGQVPYYGGYDPNSNSLASAPGTQYFPSVPPTFDSSPYANNPNRGPPYRPNSQQSNTYPSVSNYGVAQYVPGTPYPSAPGNIQPGMYSGSVAPQQSANSSYPMNYANYSSDWTSSHPRPADADVFAIPMGHVIVATVCN
ncbi:hypothetical protein B0H12DRAFT_1232311 [Mycena haematopus]|nr:hypothetical protein B0H12DRAFT_1232311 [Mycena haematopus]